jgi:hypothetical protein
LKRTNYKFEVEDIGWNKRGLSNHIGKVIGMKGALFDIYAEYSIESLRSMWFNGEFESITAVYPGQSF